MFKKYKQKINYLIKLGRYNSPTGALLLMWPCFWGTLAQFENQFNTDTFSNITRQVVQMLGC